jgi:anti-sigma regulatory factor (Ser/Thr protein kinase)
MQASEDQLVSLSFHSKASRLKLLRCVIRDSADLAGLDEDDTNAVVLAVNEACMNIMQHGYRMDPAGRINITVLKEPGALVFRLRDYADPVDPDGIRSRSLDDVRPGGLGTHFIHCLMDEVGFLATPDGRGNLFQMKKYLPSEE